MRSGPPQHPTTMPRRVGLPRVRCGERSLLAGVLLVALASRMVGPESIEPNILGDEADHLSTLYQILARGEPGPFGLSWDGNPAFSLYPAVPFLLLFGLDHVALRLAVAVGGVLMLAAFYVVCRRHCSPWAALAAMCLLASSPWALFFSRNGEVNVFVALYALLAVDALQRAVDGRSRRCWAAAGFWAGMGWYGFLAGVTILPCLLAPVLYWLMTRDDGRRRMLIGSGLLLVAFTLTVAPRLPTLVTRWGAVERYVEGRFVLSDVAPVDAPAVLAEQAGRTLRAYVLLDRKIEGNERYLAPGQAPLDPIAGTLYLGGLIVSAWRGAVPPLWLSLLVIPLVATQVPTTTIPDLARAIVALPAHFLFVGLAIDGILRTASLPRLAGAAVLVLVSVAAWTNWQGYVGWMGTLQAAAARQPAIEYEEMDEWRTEQQRRAIAGEPGLTVDDWRIDHPSAEERPQRAPQGGSQQSSP